MLTWWVLLFLNFISVPAAFSLHGRKTHACVHIRTQLREAGLFCAASVLRLAYPINIRWESFVSERTVDLSLRRHVDYMCMCMSAHSNPALRTCNNGCHCVSGKVPLIFFFFWERTQKQTTLIWSWHNILFLTESSVNTGGMQVF